LGTAFSFGSYAISGKTLEFNISNENLELLSLFSYTEMSEPCWFLSWWRTSATKEPVKSLFYLSLYICVTYTDVHATSTLRNQTVSEFEHWTPVILTMTPVILTTYLLLLGSSFDLSRQLYERQICNLLQTVCMQIP